MFRTLLNKNGLLFGIYLISIIILTISLIIANRFFEIYYDNQTLWTLLKIMGIIGVFVAFNQKRINPVLVI